MIKAFDKQNLGAIRKSLDLALASVAKEHGLSISVGNIRYNASEFGTKLVVRVSNGASGVAEVSRYSPISALGLGFKGEDMGKTVKIDGKTYEIVGCKPRAWKLPIVVKANGKLFKMGASTVARALGMEKEAIQTIVMMENAGRPDGRYDD